MSAVGWRLVYGGRTPPPGSVVRPGERLSSLRMAGLGAQHMVAMFGDVRIPRDTGSARISR